MIREAASVARIGLHRLMAMRARLCLYNTAYGGRESSVQGKGAWLSKQASGEREIDHWDLSADAGKTGIKFLGVEILL